VKPKKAKTCQERIFFLFGGMLLPQARRHRPAADLLHGWSHSQSDPGLRARTRAAYRRQRELFADVVRRWQAAGTFDPGADADGMAELMQTIILGFVAQRALAGDADVQAHVAALEALGVTVRS
jgi:hypothetical protein